MTGGESIIRTCLQGGVDTCFANPGTTEMALVAALDEVGGMRSVLGLFEGVCTGMADGYYRMSDRPALTLLHVGVGLSNGMANLHNAMRAGSGSVVVVGDHPQDHLPYQPPLAANIAGMARTFSPFVETVDHAGKVGALTAEAIAQARIGGNAVIIAPMDVMSADGAASIDVENIDPPGVDGDAVKKAVAALRSGEKCALLLSGKSLRKEPLSVAHRIARKTNCRVLSECFPGRLDRGAGLPPVERIPYFPELVLERLAGLRYLILAGATTPVSFFKYHDSPHVTVPQGCEVIPLHPWPHDARRALEAVAEELGARDVGAVTEASRPVAPTGVLDTKTLGMAIGALLPEGAIIADESATSGGPTYFLTQGCPPHSTMYLTGGGIGMGLPLATGAAIACPDQRVIALQGDGGGMYTLQALWTQAREGLKATNVILANRTYSILKTELKRFGVETPGPHAQGLMELKDPVLDWCALAKGMGVPAVRATTAEEYYKAMKNALESEGPALIEAVLG